MRGETIVAIATPGGRGAVGVVRISGPAAFAVATALCGKLPPPRQAALRSLRDADGEPLDEALVLVFTGPHSFTGEDVVELQGHGAPVLMEGIVKAACEAGARRAGPGEFTQRAYLNDKLDLAQAEAVADLVAASSLSAARAARASLAGVFSTQVTALAEALLDLRVQIEGSLDFSDEDVDWLARGEVLPRLHTVREDLEQLRGEAARGARLAEGLTVVLAGAPNSGKSTLLNRLCGEDLAIVTDVPGTTRDPLVHDLLLDGMPLRLVDTAGLRETEDRVEREGVARSYRRMQEADVVLQLLDDTAEPEPPPELAPGQQLLRVRNKCDLSGRPAGARTDGSVRICARDGQGIEALLDAIRALAGLQQSEPPFSARARHLQALSDAGTALARAAAALDAREDLDIAAAELAAAHTALGRITGGADNEDLLGAIFSRFCIGK
ncbi:tRNA uridine-5-carboxymethylaminomethyl(34) synthesis GTPase MnmE [Algiphilus aromaticivorans]|uniref:tRNA uridine-5-carboxymethylaminomethyl(34) synthesis GTPase MnmE n=1 Tax=Algiphilus aromaticivorans TaxID=382454 RepID=UPI0005C136D7|nr:tRNA uridine-5-carboxymethylaminomethyl(34) synthesis GTPase MnmE [Algiphilus aromaticivorans]